MSLFALAVKRRASLSGSNGLWGQLCLGQPPDLAAWRAAGIGNGVATASVFSRHAAGL